MKTASSSSSSSHGFPATASLCTPYLLLVPLGLLAVVLVVPSLGSSHVRSDGLGVLCHAGPSAADGYLVTPGGDAASAAAAAAETKAVVRPELLRLLVGVLTTPKRYERRNIVRLAYALQPAVPPGVAQVDVRFVFCRVADPVDAQLVALEAARHGDILVLNCTENMNDGKTHAYLSSVPRMFASSPYDYVMKTDDDTYLRVAALVDELRHKPRDDVYLGYGFAVGDDPMQFMHGMGYVVSWDVATWVSTNEDILRYNDTHAPRPPRREMAQHRPPGQEPVQPQTADVRPQLGHGQLPAGHRPRAHAQGQPPVGGGVQVAICSGGMQPFASPDDFTPSVNSASSQQLIENFQITKTQIQILVRTILVGFKHVLFRNHNRSFRGVSKLSSTAVKTPVANNRAHNFVVL
ncbi:hypothetical protein OsI_31479 [Oryza sativa Indica Group]|uniref:Hexosyltransferase n=1 Tax=Oryza sativa subsp. indica TaxID=39946 RepID=B8BFD7_ORYSI|nr:hypothetical protein OsI_31479 [Oryza sativa Indica Group]